MAYRKAPHHTGSHQVTARRVVARANANPDQTCPRCGLTREQGVARWGKQGEWEAGHVVDGDSSAGYQAEHRHCNRSAGAQAGNRRRSTGYTWP